MGCNGTPSGSQPRHRFGQPLPGGGPRASRVVCDGRSLPVQQRTLQVEEAEGVPEGQGQRVTGWGFPKGLRILLRGPLHPEGLGQGCERGNGKGRRWVSPTVRSAKQ